MTERERQRRLHVENRLAELRTKHGTEDEQIAPPPWLDHYPTSEDEWPSASREPAAKDPVNREPSPEPPWPEDPDRPPRKVASDW
jgi:hypothetical protein